MVLGSIGVAVRRRAPGVLLPRLVRPLSVSAPARQAAAAGDAAAPSSDAADAPQEPQRKVFQPRYPFSKNVVTRNEVRTWPEQAPHTPKRERINKNILPIQMALMRETDPDHAKWSLFKNKAPTQIPIGSILSVDMWNNATAKQSFTTISGVLMAVHRRGASTTFRLRTLVEKLGVEQVIPLFSPALKDIHVVKRALGPKSTIEERRALAQTPFRRFRRAKLYMIRKDERWIKHVPNLVKADRLQRLQESQKSSGATKRPFKR